MPRRPRFPVTNYPLHVVQRGNDRRPCFFAEADFRTYLDALGEASPHYGVLVHGYVLMTNHVHMLLTPLAAGAVSRVMQSVGAKYVGYVNAKYRRTGTLWEGRFRACLVDEDAYVLACCRYIDQNPVRAGVVRHPVEWRWSSYAALAGLRSERLLTPHGALAALGEVPGPAYARWCSMPSEDAQVSALRSATAGDLAYGSDTFKSRIEAMTGRATRGRRRGPRTTPSG
jgi:putative transposase